MRKSPISPDFFLPTSYIRLIQIPNHREFRDKLTETTRQTERSFVASLW